MAWTEQHGKKYRGLYRDADRRKRTAGWSTSKREALALARDQEQKIRQGAWKDPDGGKMLFSEYFENEWIPNRLRERNTVATYRSHYNSALRDPFGPMPLRNITPGFVPRWVSGRVAAGGKPGTVKAHYRTLATVLGARSGVSAVRDGLIPVSPCIGIELPQQDSREVSVYTVSEVDVLMTEVGDWWRPLLLPTADTGLRWGELMGLRVEDLTDGCAAVLVRRAMLELNKETTGNGTPFMIKDRPKGRTHRLVALTPEVSAIMSDMISARRLSVGDRLFSMPDGENPARSAAWPSGKPVGRSYFREYIWKPAHSRAGIEPRRFHDLRGSHITWLLGGNADIATVMKRVGHTQLSTTQLYVAAMEDADQRAVAALERVRAYYWSIDKSHHEDE